jgi:hypothetical protein
VVLSVAVLPYASVAGATMFSVAWSALLTSNSLLVPASVPPLFVAVICRAVPAPVTVTLPLHPPNIKLPEVVGLIEEPEVIVKLTVPVNAVTVLLLASFAVIVMPKALPAVCGLLTGDIAKWSNAPTFTIRLAPGEVLPLYVPLTVCEPAMLAVQPAPVHEPLGLIENVVEPVTSPRLLPYASNASAVYAWLAPAVIAADAGLIAI